MCVHVRTLHCVRVLVQEETNCIENAAAVLALMAGRWGGDELQPANPRPAGSGGAAPRHRAAFVRVIILTFTLCWWRYWLAGRLTHQRHHSLLGKISDGDVVSCLWLYGIQERIEDKAIEAQLCVCISSLCPCFTRTPPVHDLTQRCHRH